ncbi:MAG: hypothetical protein C4522_16620 [Desulfobacteraceae bacterium]|nr:MAG: hypothetical protein C4522_16620 [Desulfobacteraceae bacterium]
MINPLNRLRQFVFLKTVPIVYKTKTVDAESAFAYTLFQKKQGLILFTASRNILFSIVGLIFNHISPDLFRQCGTIDK